MRDSRLRASTPLPSTFVLAGAAGFFESCTYITLYIYLLEGSRLPFDCRTDEGAARDLCIKFKFSTAHHLHSADQSEPLNFTVLQMLRCFVNKYLSLIHI